MEIETDEDYQLTSESKAVEHDLKTWAIMLAMALESENKQAAIYAIKEIESIISRVCYRYDLFEEMPVK